jgi:2-polyprenyl-3-methyl-5-hydroxy-6-metoxy-1,4-benzoquinol methylase
MPESGHRMADVRTQDVRDLLSEPDIHEQWESDYLNSDLNEFYDRVFQRMTEVLAPRPGEKLLDAGSGYCFHAVRLARSGLQVTGVDFSEVALRHGAEVIERAGMRNRVSVQKGDLLNLPFSEETFDYVHCWGVLMHVPQIETALTELIRLVKPGGKLVLMENNADSLHLRVKTVVRGLLHLLGRPLKERRKTDWGCEEWETMGNSRLLVRAANIDYLVRFCAKRGLRLVERFPSQFTELYAKLPNRVLKQIVYRFNQFWFDWIQRPELAMGNVLIFEKASACPD